MSRVAKQFSYALFYVILWAAIIFAVYSIFFKSAPTCFDNKQNQKEEGIDCGGSCVACELKTNPISVKNLRLIEKNDFTIVIAEIQNNSINYGAARFFYSINLNDVSDKLIFALPRNESFIYPAQARKVLVSFINKKDNPGIIWKNVSMADSQVNIFASETEWARKEIFVKPNVAIANYTINPADSNLEIKGTIKNQSNFSISSAQIIAFVKDGSGQLRGVLPTTLSNVTAFSSRDFTINYNLETEKILQPNLEFVIEAK